MTLFFLLFCSIFLGISQNTVFAGDDLSIFGYFQTYFSQTNIKTTIENSHTHYSWEQDSQSNSFLLQQANLFLEKEISPNFMGWINLEFTNSFSTERNWGTFNIDEAWIKYNPSNKFKIKLGLLTPIFNNLNEVKNRTPYLPYIYRPGIYESSLSDIIRMENYRPERAYMQIYGALPAMNQQIDYAFYCGNSENDNIISSSEARFIRGADSTHYLLIGGRVGLRSLFAKLGFSFTYDHDNLHAVGLGDEVRKRYGLDLSFSYRRIDFEGEYVHTSYKPMLKMDKRFYYAKIGYNFTNELFSYIMFDYLNDESVPSLKNGMNAYKVGGGYRFSDSIIFKMQYVQLRILDGEIYLPPPMNAAKYKFKLQSFLLAVSVSI
ncbi:hypothetical protein GF337_15155 [candidate division KSB1 bacterium]|nr:hypothetical protein [candidate division KSB1 bacterium]